MLGNPAEEHKNVKQGMGRVYMEERQREVVGGGEETVRQ
jgi:hypothetical protein